MNRISEFDNFINSSLDEIDYFNKNRDEYLLDEFVTLQEFYIYLRDLDKKFENDTYNELKKIQEKCDWISQVFYYFNLVNKKPMFDIKSIEGLNKYYATYNFELKRYSSFDEKQIPRLYLLSKNVRRDIERGRDYILIQDELEKMGEIGQKIYGENLSYTSATENFMLHYRPSIGLYVFMKQNYLSLSRNNYSSFAKILNFERDIDDSVYLDESENEKIMKRILIKK